MINYRLLLLFSFFANLSFAQNHTYETVIATVKKEYNSTNYQGVFDQFSESMKEALPLEKTKAFLEDLQTQQGKMHTTKFSYFQQGTYASYETVFDNGLFAVNISLDNDQKIDGFFIQPYTDTGKNTINMLIDLPTTQATILFNTVKVFPNNTQLSIALIENSKISYYGVVKVNDTVKHLENRNKHFEIGSITKVFTSALLAQLVAKKKVSLNDPINPYFDEPFRSSPTITFLELANHTSGFPRLPQNMDMTKIDSSNPYKTYLESHLREAVQEISIEDRSAKVYAYSNFGTAVLGYSLAKSQGKTYFNLLQDQVLNPCGLTQTFKTSTGLEESLVKGLDATGKETSNWDFDVMFPAGGLVSTAEDLSKFALAQLNPKNTALALTTVPTHTISEKLKIGLGWHISKEETAKSYVYHNGGTGGYTSLIALDLDNNNGVVILSNVSGYSPFMGNIDQMGFELMEDLSALTR